MSYFRVDFVVPVKAANLEVFAVDSGDRSLWHTYLSKDGWGSWQNYLADPNDRVQVSDVVPVVGGHLELFAIRAHDGALLHTYLDGDGWHGWSLAGPPGGGLGSGQFQVLGCFGAQARNLEMFAIAADNTLWHNYLSGDWQGWTSNFNGAPPLLDGFATYCFSHLEVYGIGRDQRLWHCYLDGDGNWHPWAADPVVPKAAKVTAVLGSNLEVFVLAPDHVLWHNYLSGSTWGAWTSNFSGAPLFASIHAFNSGNVELFGVALDGTLWHTFLDSSGWHPWEERFNGGLSVRHVAGATSRHAELFVVGSGAFPVPAAWADGTLWHSYLADGGWHGWDANFLMDKDYDCWLGKYLPAPSPRRLREITLPGTHHSDSSTLTMTPSACRSSIWTQIALDVTRKKAICQHTDVTTQLFDGARYFDLRACYDDGEFHTHHQVRGAPTRDALQQINGFLQVRPEGELVLVELAVSGAQEDDEGLNQKLIGLAEGVLGKWLWPRTGDGRRLAEHALGEIVNPSSKVVVLYNSVNFEVKHLSDTSTEYPHAWSFLAEVKDLYIGGTDPDGLWSEMQRQLGEAMTDAATAKKLIKAQWLLEEEGGEIAKFWSSLEDLESGLEVTLSHFLDANLDKRINVIFVDWYEKTNAVVHAMGRSLPPGPDPSTLYFVTNKLSGKVLDVNEMSTGDGALLHQWDRTGADNQRWQFRPTGDGYYVIVSKRSGKVLDIKDYDTRNGVIIQQYALGARQPNQEWTLVPIGANQYKILSRLDGKAVGVDSARMDTGAWVVQWDSNNSNDQIWTIAP